MIYYYAGLRKSKPTKFYIINNYTVEITATYSKFVIAIHDLSKKTKGYTKKGTKSTEGTEITKEPKEYMHLTCFKSKPNTKAYAHITFINNSSLSSKDKFHYFYNNDNVYTFDNLIDLCYQIRDAVFTPLKI